MELMQTPPAQDLGKCAVTEDFPFLESVRIKPLLSALLSFIPSLFALQKSLSNACLCVCVRACVWGCLPLYRLWTKILPLFHHLLSSICPLSRYNLRLPLRKYNHCIYFRYFHLVFPLNKQPNPQVSLSTSHSQ